MADCASCDDCAFDAEADMPTDLHEIHITVRHDTSGAFIGSFMAACDVAGVKPIVISYSNRDDPSQDRILDPMTSQKFRGDEGAALEEAERIAFILEERGFEVIRTKIETVPANPIWNKGTGYFESHIGVVLPKTRVESLRSAANSLGAHVSANPFKDHGDTITQMVTVRADARDTTPDRFTQHMEWMRCMIEIVADVETDRLIVEYCWYDSNKGHDKAWMGA